MADEVLEIRFKRVSGTSFAVYLGSRGGIGDRQCYIGQYNSNFVASIGTTNSTALVGYDTNEHTIAMDTETGLVSIDGGSGVNCGTFVASPFDLYLFALNTSNSPNNYARVRIIQAKIGTRMDLVSVRCGTVGYMYDRVSGTLFGNDGTGDFVVGDDV